MSQLPHVGDFWKVLLSGIGRFFVLQTRSSLPVSQTGSAHGLQNTRAKSNLPACEFRGRPLSSTIDQKPGEYYNERSRLSDRINRAENVDKPSTHAHGGRVAVFIPGRLLATLAS